MAGFSDRLKEERKRLGLSQADMAAAGGVGLNSQSNYENGHRSPDAVYLERIASLGVDIGYLVLGSRGPALSPALHTEPSTDFLVPLRPGWQSVDGPVIGWISERFLKADEASNALVQEAQQLGVEWVTSAESLTADGLLSTRVEADFALVPARTTAPAGSLMERIEIEALRFHRGAYAIDVLTFETLLSDARDRGLSIRDALWRKVFAGGAFDADAVFLLTTSRRPGKHLLRVRRVLADAGEDDHWLSGNWEATGEVAEVPLASIDGLIVHAGTGETFAASDFAQRFRAREGRGLSPREDHTRMQEPASASTVGLVARVLTPEQAALLDNYEAADERGRAAARSVLDALAQPKRANG